MAIMDLFKRFTPFKKQYDDSTSALSQVLSSWRNGGESPRLNQSNIGLYLGRYADQAWIYSCIKIIQTKGAGVPLKVYTKVGEDLVEQKNHPLKQLLDSVNPFMNGYDLMEGTHGFIELAGNAYWLLDRMVAGKPTEIYPLNPQCIKIKADKKRNVIGYSYELEPGRVERVFEPEEILHFKTWNPLDSFYGLAPICAARDSSDMMMFSDQYNKAFFRNGAEPSGVLMSDQSIDEESKKRIASTWKKLHQGVRKAHSIAIMDGGMKYQSTASTHREMEFGELKRMTREDVLTVFNIPPIMVGVFDEANYSNAKEQRRIFWVDCMIPRLRKIESVINERLVKPYDPNLVVMHDLNGIEDLAEDEDKRSRADSVNVASGIMTINEVRKRKNLEDVEWGDTWYAPFGLAPVTLPGEEPKEPVIDPNEPPPVKAITATIKTEVPQLPDPVLEDPKKVRRDQVWMQYKGLTERLENRWGPVMRQLFTDQEREVINKIEDSDWKKTVDQNRLDKLIHVKQSIDLILFDRTKWRTIFRKDAQSLMQYTIAASAKAQIDEYALGIDFSLTDHNVFAWLNSKAFKFADEVNRTTEDALRRELNDAIANGETISQVEDRIAGVFDIARGSRTATIARTEVISASNEGAFESYRQSGLVNETEWVSSRDNLVRDDHQIDGEVVTLGHDFSNGLKYPGDPSGEPSNVINCRCTIAPIVKKGNE